MKLTFLLGLLFGSISTKEHFKVEDDITPDYKQGRVA